MDARQRVVLVARRSRRARSRPGQLADVAVLSKDFFAVPEAEIQTIESVLTIVGGEVVLRGRRTSRRSRRRFRR